MHFFLIWALSKNLKSLILEREQCQVDCLRDNCHRSWYIIEKEDITSEEFNDAIYFRVFGATAPT